MTRAMLMFAVLACGCGHHHNVGSGPDAAGGGGGGGGGTGDAGGDAPGDAGNPACVAAGTPAQVSIDTRAHLDNPLIANDGTNTIVAWSVFPSTFDRAAWAELSGGAVIASGTFDAAIDTRTAQLVVLSSTIYLFQPRRALYKFNGNGWDTITFVADRIVVSGTLAFGLTSLGNNTSAIVFDGTTVSASHTISSTSALADAAADGAGGIGVLTLDLSFTTYSGTWSVASSIGSSPVPFLTAHLAHSAALWGVAIDPLAATDPPYAWVDTAGTWKQYKPGVASIVAFAGNNSTFAMSTLDGKVAVYASGAWTISTVFSGTTTSNQLAAYGNGYVEYAGSSAALFDGSSWSTPAFVGSIGSSPLVVVGTTIAAASNSGYVASYRNATWSYDSLGTGARATAVAIAGTTLIAGFTTAGAVSATTNPSGTWSAALALPTYKTSGPVVSAQLARAGNGHALALWAQWDDGNIDGFAAEYDGCHWGAPVSLAVLNGYGQLAGVAGNATGFVIVDGAHNQVAPWTGSGLGTPTSTGLTTQIASDGTTFVAVWEVGGVPTAATSSDGVTWSAPQALDSVGASVNGVVGGGAGVLAYWNSATTATARVWHGGSWSAPTTLPAPYGPLTCQTTVASATAVVACGGTSSLAIELWSGGAWSAVPIATATPYLLASDGTDYRIDYGLYTTMWSSVILHAGAWSSPASAMPTGLSPLGSAGRGGTWSALGSYYDTSGVSHYAVQRASGGGTYATPTIVTPQQPIELYYSVHPFANIAGHSDAVLVNGHPSYRSVDVLDVAFDL